MVKDGKTVNSTTIQLLEAQVANRILVINFQDYSPQLIGLAYADLPLFPSHPSFIILDSLTHPSIMTSTKYIVLPQAANVEWGDELYGDLEIRSDGKQHPLMDF